MVKTMVYHLSKKLGRRGFKVDKWWIGKDSKTQFFKVGKI